jgi:branched-chain amino acid transport system substrate-binding protein
MKKISIFLAVIVGILVLGIIANNDRSNTVKNRPIKIGAVISLTGDASPWGEYGKKGMELAVKTINDSGGIKGRKVEMIFEDDHTDPKQGVSAFNKLNSIDKVDGIIGGVFDFTAQPLFPLALNNNLALISPSNFRIPGGFDLNQQTFVMLTDFDKTIRKIEPYLASSSFKKMGVVHFESTFGKEIAKTLDEVTSKLGMSKIVDESYSSIGNNDFKTTIIKLKSQKVDAVFLDMVANDPINFLRQAKQLDYSPTIITYNGTLDAFAGESDKSLLEGVVILNWEVTSKEFDRLFSGAYNMPATKSVDKYFDAVYVMAHAIANSSDRTGVAKYISNNTFSTPNNDSISFNENHAVDDIAVRVQVMKGGKMVEL